MPDFDVVIIGAGSAGYVSSIRAVQLGRKVGLIEQRQMAGSASIEGCIPTKDPLRSAEILNPGRSASEFGIGLKVVAFDVPSVTERTQSCGQAGEGIGSPVFGRKMCFFS